MSVHERALDFDCGGERLVGVASVPDRPRSLGLVVVVGGPQYRAGSHRQFVELTRYVAAQGVATLRFDVRGMGDSEGGLRSFENLDDDIAVAINALVQAVPQVHRVVLWGLCDGASAALLYLDRHPGDGRVAGLCLVNPWVRSEASLAQTHVKHYYSERLRQREFWLKLLSGRGVLTAAREFAANLRKALRGSAAYWPDASSLPFQLRMARAFRMNRRPLLLVLSGRDYTAREFVQVCEVDPAWRGALVAPNVKRLDIATADHTFSAMADRASLNQGLAAWLAGVAHEMTPCEARGCERTGSDIKVQGA